jgi:hypothetical protein
MLGACQRRVKNGGSEMFHTSYHGLEFEEKWRVVFLVFLQLRAGTSKDFMGPCFIGLGEYCTESSRDGSLTGLTLCDQVIGSVLQGILEEQL